MALAQKVGVVMSGGGAKGLYHIGVLQALEENSIPIDYVAGTSMGAIVGGFYAAGYSPQEIAEIATSGKMIEWMSGRIDNNYGAYFREHNQFRRDDPILSIRIDTDTPNKILHIPRGIIQSTQVDMALSSYLAPANVACEEDFDNLMVPFLCVASDIAERKGVVFRSGDLGIAVRASMALPVAFNPILQDSMILYDGGISDNFPWKPAREAFDDMEFVIGVSCSSQNVELSDDISVIDHILLLTMNRTDYDIPEELGVKIERDVPVGTLDFSQAANIIKIGYDDTKQMIDSIKLRITRRTTPQEFAVRRKAFRDKSPTLIFDNYEVKGLDSNQLEYVHGYMATKRKDHYLRQREMSFDELRDNLYSILSSNDFSTEFPQITYNDETDRYKFAINLTNKPQLKLSLGGNISSTAFNQIYFSADYKHIGSVAKTAYAEAYLGPVYNTGIMGGRIDLYRKFPIFFDTYVCVSYKNLDHGNFGLLTSATNTLAVKSNDSYLSLGLGMPISKRMMFTVRSNVGVENFKYTPVTANPSILDVEEAIDQTKLRFATAKGELERITFDKPLFPTKGSKLTISSIFLHGIESTFREESNSADNATFETIPKFTHNWYGVRLRYDKYITSTKSNAWFSMGINLDGVYTNVDDFATSTASSMILPAYQPTLHTQMLFMPEYSARYYAAGGLMPQFTILENFYAKAGVFTMFRERYEGKDGEVPFPIGNQYSMQFISDFSLVYHTRIAPLSLSFSKYGLANKDNFYITFNFGYSIFAPRGTFY
ncbi:MAG: patatin-like phospholipase family protein [Rikenellaceae bacterium]